MNIFQKPAQISVSINYQEQSDGGHERPGREQEVCYCSLLTVFSSSSLRTSFKHTPRCQATVLSAGMGEHDRQINNGKIKWPETHFGAAKGE